MKNVEQWELEKERTNGAFSKSQKTKGKIEEGEKQVFRERERVGR